MKPLEDREGSEVLARHVETCALVVTAATFAAERAVHGSRQESEAAAESFLRAVRLSIGTGELVYEALNRGPLVDPAGGQN
jgi:hypothetical protein